MFLKNRRHGARALIPLLLVGFLTIPALARAQTYTITASAGPNGSISPAGPVVVPAGGSQTFIITANPNYQIQDVLVNGSSIGRVSSRTFSNVSRDHTISATFKLKEFTISAGSGSNGTISPSGGIFVTFGNDKTFVITPFPHYHILSVRVDGMVVGTPSSYTFFAVNANHTILASFAIDTYTIMASAGPNGSISSPGTSTVNYGSSKSYTITPSVHYHIADVLVDGMSVGPVSSYTFSDVDDNHTIAASFAIDTHTLTTTVVGQGAVGRVPDQPSYDYGTTVQLTAVPAAGWEFTGWSGDASGANNPVPVLIDGDKTVTATFCLVIEFNFNPGTITLDERHPNKWVKGTLTAPKPYAGSDFDVASIRLNGTVSVDPSADVDVDKDQVKVRFLRTELLQLLMVGSVTLTVTGSIGSECFIGRDEVLVRTRRHGVQGVPSVEITSPMDAGPAMLSLAPPSPNPGSGEVLFRLGLTRAGDASLELYDAAGRRITTLLSGAQSAGWHEVEWNGLAASGQSAGAGVFFAVLRAEDRVITRRIVRL